MTKYLDSVPYSVTLNDHLGLSYPQSVKVLLSFSTYGCYNYTSQNLLFFALHDFQITFYAMLPSSWVQCDPLRRFPTGSYTFKIVAISKNI